MNRNAYVTIVSKRQELLGERERCREGEANAVSTILIDPLGVGYVSDLPVLREA